MRHLSRGNKKQWKQNLDAIDTQYHVVDKKTCLTKGYLLSWQKRLYRLRIFIRIGDESPRRICFLVRAVIFIHKQGLRFWNFCSNYGIKTEMLIFVNKHETVIILIKITKEIGAKLVDTTSNCEIYNWSCRRKEKLESWFFGVCL